MNSGTAFRGLGGRGWLGGVALVALGLSACVPDEDLFVMSEMHKVAPNPDGVLEPVVDGPAGFTCQDISSGNGDTASGSTDDDFWMRETTREDGLRVVVGSLDEELERRFYGRDFIESAGVDRFTIETASGAQYEFVYWGARSCESAPPP
jgi:hypothetical protein